MRQIIISRKRLQVVSDPVPCRKQNGGGDRNAANGGWSFVGGGLLNIAAGNNTAIGGGNVNYASGDYASIMGGSNNTASGYIATVAGGSSNVAQGTASFAAGTRAKANHNGTFVWGDSSPFNDVASTAANQFIARASGGAPNDLLDVRQKAVDRLAELTGAVPVPTNTGDVSLFLSGGAALVSGDEMVSVWPLACAKGATAS